MFEVFLVYSSKQEQHLFSTRSEATEYIKFLTRKPRLAILRKEGSDTGKIFE